MTAQPLQQGTADETISPQTELPVTGFDSVTFYVGNAKQAAYFYRAALGFDIIGYRGPETGHPETVTYLLQQNNLRFALTSALSPHHPVAQHVQAHGDGIRDIAFACTDVGAAYETALARGAQSVSPPETLQDDHGTLVKATIATYGDTTHTLIDRRNYPGPLEPGFQALFLPGESIGLQRIDHAVGNVETGRMDDWVRYYESVFGFYVFRYYSEKDISTRYSALVSKVMANRSGSIKMPINQPAPGVMKSQIQEYIDFYGSAGVQHLAISTDNILHTVNELRRRGIMLMTVPQAYYEDLAERVGEIRESVPDLAQLGILVDREEGGYLLQIFTQPMQDRPTFFFEIIQRQGAQGFGKGNFKALFEAIERDQARRGNL